MSSFTQKAEAFIASVESEVFGAEAVVVAWFKKLVHHNAAGGTISPVPPPAVVTTAPGPVPALTAAPSPSAAAPQPAPQPPSFIPQPTQQAPAAAPVTVPAPAVAVGATSSPLPSGVIAIDDRGFCQLAAIESERASNPNWAKVPKWFAIELDNYSLSFNAAANLTEAKLLLATGAVNGLNAQALNQAYAMSPSPTGANYERGLPYTDALSFIGDNKDLSGAVTFKGPRPSDMSTFVANCNAAYAAAVARGDVNAVANTIPILYPAQNGVVAKG